MFNLGCYWVKKWGKFDERVHSRACKLQILTRFCWKWALIRRFTWSWRFINLMQLGLQIFNLILQWLQICLHFINLCLALIFTLDRTFKGLLLILSINPKTLLPILPKQCHLQLVVVIIFRYHSLWMFRGVCLTLRDLRYFNLLQMLWLTWRGILHGSVFTLVQVWLLILELNGV